MAIEFHCPECNSLIRVPDNASGKKGTCPSCRVKLRVPKVEVPDPSAGLPAQPVEPTPVTPEPEPSDPEIPPRPDFMPPPPAAAQPSVQTPVPVQPTFPQAPALVPGAPAFPQAPVGPAAQFPGPPDAAPPVQPGAPQFPAPPGQAAPAQPDAPQFPGAPGGAIVPAVAASQSVSRQARRLARRKKGGLLFPIICGLILAGGLGWMYLNLGPDIDGERVAYSQTGAMMRPKVLSPSLVDLQTEIVTTVLTHFEEDPLTLRTKFVETRFTKADEGGLQIQILTGSESRFVRFPIDADLRSWYNSNVEDLEEPRRTNLGKSLKDFFTDQDVAIRNQSGVENPLQYRDDVGLTGCVGGLGYHVEAIVGSSPFRCVFEDDGNLYFLIPVNREKFKIVGRSVNKNGPKLFPGEYEVTIVPDRKKSSAVVSEDDG